VKGGRGGVLVQHYFLNKNANFRETWTPQKIVIFWRKLPPRLAIPKKQFALTRKVSSNCPYPFPFPFPQSSQSRERPIPRFPFLVPKHSLLKDFTLTFTRQPHLQLPKCLETRKKTKSLQLNTPVVKCKYYVSQKQNGFNNQIHWYIILLTFYT